MNRSVSFPFSLSAVLAECGAISTLGKVIRRGSEWLGISATAPERTGGVIEVPELAACLTLNKGDFIRTGPRGATYLSFRKAIQQAVARQLAEWGDAQPSTNDAPPREVRPLQRDLAYLLEDLAGLGVQDQVSELGQTVGEALITPTRIYSRPIRKILTHYKVKNVVHGIAHITGGGIRDNLERILPDKTQAVIAKGSWSVPPIFTWLQKLGGIEDAEMERVFNMGIGMCLVVSEYYAESIQQQLAGHGLASWQIGKIVDGCGEARWA